MRIMLLLVLLVVSATRATGIWAGEKFGPPSTMVLGPQCQPGEIVKYSSRDNTYRCSGSWHLLTQTYAGKMQLVKYLTKHECEFMRARALGLPATAKEERELAAARARYKKEYEKCMAATGPRICTDPDASVSGVDPNSIKTAECFE